MESEPKYRLFEVTGIELEYMIVDRDTLKVCPIADLVMQDKSGEFAADIVNGKIEWSNELVNHVLELKTHRPEPSLKGVAKEFHKNILEIDMILSRHNAMLLPSAAHPFMNPGQETELWKHDYSNIYSLYHRIFDCRSHGWANLQSMHLNLPFCDDEEFSRLHAAIRLLLPIIPAIAASSPVLDGVPTGWADSRMEAYLHHQQIMPSLMGKLIPEPVYSEEDYALKIFNPIRQDIGPFDHNGIMEHHFLNSRGAIARFDRGAIEIRVIDTQECPAADIALAEAITQVLKLLVKEKWTAFRYQAIWKENELFNIFHDVIREGEHTEIRNGAYLRMFGLKENTISANGLWKHLYKVIARKMERKNGAMMKKILDEGTLSSRIMKRLDGDYSNSHLVSIYTLLAYCLKKNMQLGI